MLCFVFSALVVVLDQLFKHWAVLALSDGTDITVIPGIIGLTYVENPGAAFGIFSDMRWPLAAVAFICAVILVFILMRYDGGFWSRLGLAAVLGGTVGNLIDRVFNGVVVDMFRFLFWENFAIFNIADVFLMVGGITFCVFYIIAGVKESREEKEQPAPRRPAREVMPPPTPVQKPRVLPKTTDSVSPPTPAPAQKQGGAQLYAKKPHPSPTQKTRSPLDDPPPFAKKNAEMPKKSVDSDSAEYSDYLKGLSETLILEEFDLDRLMSEYGFDDDKD